jgi:hypothetical protein
MSDSPTKHPSLTVVPRSESLASLIATYKLSPGLRSRVDSAEVLLVPSRGYMDDDSLYFPQGTPELLSLLEHDLPKGTVVEAALDEDEYRELALHGIIITLATIFCSVVLFPLVKDLLVRFIDERRAKAHATEVTCRARILVATSKDSSYTEITYNGPAAGFQEALSNAAATIATGAAGQQQLKSSAQETGGHELEGSAEEGSGVPPGRSRGASRPSERAKDQGKT